ncbi:MAG TPA: 30S ribosomal protein S13 [Ignavibacteriales bacterium]|nr:30S ribosomal protein S13 [Ignavibacteriales bacterium]HOL80156.1 30S ribosomal protein S13 [Ignavibacteriales bacterium]HOM64438.1 30S ribosomal protein S13 [Ignavibacteriales bacterium]HPD67925.1 30S ribosomal protein S13 [Ignavibacteriales bacterium]HPP32345.1 30S ribosomal protein S13 [Ignavibacteriales bacterium]
MARIAGVDIPKNKKVWIGLTYLYGIGPTNTFELCEKANVDPHKRVHELTEEEIAALRNIIDRDYKVEGSLRTEIQQNIKRLMEIGCYRGTRHKKGLPVRGQRTKTNSRTRKGKRRTVANKKKAVKK